MTVETRLREEMADVVAPTIADSDRLVAEARRRGLGIRRRRQALASVGVAAAVGLVALAPTVVAGDHGPGTGPRPMAVGGSASDIPTAPTDPLTGRAAAAALLYAVGQEARGTAGDVRGSATSRGVPESYVIFRFTPAGSDTAGEVAMNVQPQFLGSDVKPGDRADAGRCQPAFMEHCTARRLPDGSRLLTYDDPSSYGSGGVRRVASRYYPAQDLRVIASATNGYDVTERAEQVTRDEPVLSSAQLVAIVSQPWWGPRLPAYFTAQGAQLEGYSDRSATSRATATPSAQ